jgi:hypothetical protein
MASGKVIVGIIGAIAVIAGVTSIAYNYSKVVETQNTANVAKQRLVNSCMDDKQLVIKLSGLATSPNDPNVISGVDHYNSHCAQYTGVLIRPLLLPLLLELLLLLPVTQPRSLHQRPIILLPHK